jgi:hypothetical protein
MIWLFLILALSTVAVSLVGLAAYLRVRSHMKDVPPEKPTARINPELHQRISDPDTENLQHGETRDSSRRPS